MNGIKRGVCSAVKQDIGAGDLVVIDCNVIHFGSVNRIIQQKHEGVTCKPNTITPTHTQLGLLHVLSCHSRKTLTCAPGGPGNTEPGEHGHVPDSDHFQRQGQAAARCAGLSGLPDICSCIYASEDTGRYLAETSA